MKKLRCSVGIIIYNEAKNIQKLLISLLNQKTEIAIISEIIIISSGSTDGSDEIVTNFILNHPDKNIKLFTESQRKGKASAINLFLSKAENDIIIIESGDTIPASNTVELLIKPFIDNKIGMTGPRPIPVNKLQNLASNLSKILWEMHHFLSLRQPKLGEMIAFRKIFNSIPIDSAVDEASIESLIRKNNLEIKYIPSAIVYNKGPENLTEYIKQRKRIYAGHLWLMSHHQYSVSSMNIIVLVKIILCILISNFKNLKIITFLSLTVIIEIYSRISGFFDFYLWKKNPYIWDIAHSTKELKGNSND